MLGNLASATQLANGRVKFKSRTVCWQSSICSTLMCCHHHHDHLHLPPHSHNHHLLQEAHWRSGPQEQEAEFPNQRKTQTPKHIHECANNYSVKERVNGTNKEEQTSCWEGFFPPSKDEERVWAKSWRLGMSDHRDSVRTFTDLCSSPSCPRFSPWLPSLFSLFYLILLFSFTYCGKNI